MQEVFRKNITVFEEILPKPVISPEIAFFETKSPFCNVTSTERGVLRNHYLCHHHIMIRGSVVLGIHGAGVLGLNGRNGQDMVNGAVGVGMEAVVGKGNPRNIGFNFFGGRIEISATKERAASLAMRFEDVPKTRKALGIGFLIFNGQVGIIDRDGGALHVQHHVTTGSALGGDFHGKIQGLALQDGVFGEDGGAVLSSLEVTDLDEIVIRDARKLGEMGGHIHAVRAGCAYIDLLEGDNIGTAFGDFLSYLTEVFVGVLPLFKMSGADVEGCKSEGGHGNKLLLIF